jgi:hypothetical protein
MGGGLLAGAGCQRVDNQYGLLARNHQLGESEVIQTGRARGFAGSARPNGPACFIIKTLKTNHRVREIN